MKEIVIQKTMFEAEDGKMFETEDVCREYERTKTLDRVWIVYSNTRDMEGFSSMELAEESLKFLSENDLPRYKIQEIKIDLVLR